MAEKALYILNSHAQIQEKKAQLEAADIVICAPSIDPIAARDATDALLLASFNCVSMVAAGPNNETMQRLREVLTPFTYANNTRDPDYPDDIMLRPSLELAEAYAALIDEVVARGFHGPYLDQSWNEKPTRYFTREIPYWLKGRNALQAQMAMKVEWMSYMNALVWYLGKHDRIAMNCANNPGPLNDRFNVIVCDERRPSDDEMAVEEKLLNLSTRRGGAILWFGARGLSHKVAQGDLL